MKGIIEYRGFTIESDATWKFIIAHQEYTGPEDFCTTGETIADCIEQVDELMFYTIK